MEKDTILNTNKNYWNKNADDWFGVTALPIYGVKIPSENELRLFGNVANKKLLEIGCGSGHSLKYHADNNARELWGMDISKKQLDNAKEFSVKNNYDPKLICSAMEDECGIPSSYFDIVYSIYAIGWTTDLNVVFKRIASYLKKDGLFIFSWQHPLRACVDVKDGELVIKKSYFDENYYSHTIDDMEIIVSDRRISTYINALACAGFIIEKIVEQTDDVTLSLTDEIDDKSLVAQSIPLSFIIKARKA